jgi:hypothetical protein
MTREEHLAKLRELLKLNDNDTHTVKGKSGDHNHELILLRQEKEFLEHEIEKLTWLEEGNQQAPTAVSSSNIDRGGDDGSGENREPVLV